MDVRQGPGTSADSTVSTWSTLSPLTAPQFRTTVGPRPPPDWQAPSPPVPHPLRTDDGAIDSVEPK